MPRTARTRGRGIVWTDDSLFDNMTRFPVVMDQAMGQVFEYEATEAQNMMRTNAPWQDKTGNARQGLFTATGRTESGHFMVLYHTMPYGIWLEVRHNGQYAVIEPSLQPVGLQVMQSLRRLFNLMEAAA